MKAVVFVAGKGERLWPLTERRPKPLLPVAGRPIIENTLRAIVEAGIREIVLVVGYGEEKIREFVGDGGRLGFRATFVRQERPKGTADALRACEPWLHGDSRFIIIYGDDYYSRACIVRFAKAARRSQDESIAAAEVDDPSRFGRLDIDKGLVRSIREKVSGHGSARVNAGLYLLSDSVFKAAAKTKMSARGEYELTDTIGLMIRTGRRIRPFSVGKSEWLGVTYPWDLLDVNRLELESNFSPAVQGKVEEGVRITKSLRVGKGSVIRSGCYIEGPVIVGEDSSIGPNSYLRPFTSIGRNCKVGASCEVKNSILMDNVKVPHLAYLGDSIVGEGSSLGAGTITANLRFDGLDISSEVKGKWVDSRRRKLGAILGDEVRTGINVSFFPGVKVGSGAWIGPGVVVGRDVAARERIKEDTSRPSKR